MSINSRLFTSSFAPLCVSFSFILLAIYEGFALQTAPRNDSGTATVAMRPCVVPHYARLTAGLRVVTQKVSANAMFSAVGAQPQSFKKALVFLAT